MEKDRPRTRTTLRLRRGVRGTLLFAAFIVTLAACTQGPPGPLGAVGGIDPIDFKVVVTDDPTPQTLAAATVGGTVEIFLSSETSIDAVSYYLDAMPGSGGDVQAEAATPFTLRLDTTGLSDGPHTLFAVVTARDAPPDTIEIGFHVHNGRNRKNQAPKVDAGPDGTAAVGTPATLSGSATDDGLPDSTLKTTWTKARGPGTVTFGDASATTTTVTFSKAGSYTLRLTASDGALSTSDKVVVIVSAQAADNAAPAVDAGPDRVLTLPGDLHLAGSASDDGLPANHLTLTWSKTSGPGSVTFSSPDAASTNATFSTAGTYVLTLTADDGELSSSDRVSVTVEPEPTTPNTPPIVDAGADMTITLPASARLSGSVHDDGLPNGTTTHTWRKISGPSTVTFAQPTDAVTDAGFGASGTYTLELDASDGDLSASDRLTVVVLPDPPAGGGSGEMDLDLRGNPAFDESDLAAGTRVWYDRMLAAMASSKRYPDPVYLASTGDSYQIGRYTGTDVTSLLTVFRFTGDLRLLDDVDASMQAARAELKDDDGDGYLNWQWLCDPNETKYYKTDRVVLDELMTAGLVAEVAWAYEHNRDLASPSGVDYGERADFWLDYLQQWEAKWRGRDHVPTGFPFIDKHIIHAWVNLDRYMWYMHRLTGRQDYLDEANRLANVVNTKELRTISTADGTGYAWAVVMTAYEPSSQWWIVGVHYARYTTQVLMDLAFEPFGAFTTDNTLVRIAHSISGKVIDNGALDFARTIAGDQPIAGLIIDPADRRTDAAGWAIYPMTDYAAFDATGAIADASKQVYANEEADANHPTRIYIPAGLVLDDLIRSMHISGAG